MLKTFTIQNMVYSGRIVVKDYYRNACEMDENSFIWLQNTRDIPEWNQSGVKLTHLVLECK